MSIPARNTRIYHEESGSSEPHLTATCTHLKTRPNFHNTSTISQNIETTWSYESNLPYTKEIHAFDPRYQGVIGYGTININIYIRNIIIPPRRGVVEKVPVDNAGYIAT
jgi:hypothetical protein